MKFEYKQVEFNLGWLKKEKRNDELHEMLNDLGNDGWELAGFSTSGEGSGYMYYVFKRPKKSDF